MIYKKAFTLIELLIVIAIIGILSGFIAISLNGALVAAKDTKRKADIDTLKKGLLYYKTLNDNYPIADCDVNASCTALYDALVPTYIASLPTDPDGDYYSYVSTNGSDFTVSSTLSNATPYSYTASTGFSSSAPAVAWLTGGYTKRQPITIDSSAALTDYQVSLNVTYDSDMQSDFDDLRFATSDTTLLNYWIESKTDSSTAKIWVKVPSLSSGSNTIYMYYGNSSATTGSNGSNTFAFFDDFSGDLNKWTIASKAGYTTVEISGGQLVGHRNVDWNYIMAAVNTNASFAKTTPWAIHFSHKMVGTSPWGGCADKMKAMLVSFSGNVTRNAYDSGGCATQGHASSNYSYLWHNTGNGFPYKTMEIDLDGAGQMKLIDNGVAGSWQSTPSWADINASGFNFELICMGSGGGGGNDYCYYDNVYIRKYAATNPTTSFNAEESN